MGDIFLWWNTLKLITDEHCDRARIAHQSLLSDWSHGCLVENALNSRILIHHNNRCLICVSHLLPLIPPSTLVAHLLACAACLHYTLMKHMVLAAPCL